MTMNVKQYTAFMRACRGNWRNSCFISCIVCKCRTPCSGYLMSANADGKPVLLSVAEYEAFAMERIDATECRGRLSRSAFEDIYSLYLSWCLADGTSCCLQMLSSSFSANT